MVTRLKLQAWHGDTAEATGRTHGVTAEATSSNHGVTAEVTGMTWWHGWSYRQDKWRHDWSHKQVIRYHGRITAALLSTYRPLLFAIKLHNSYSSKKYYEDDKKKGLKSSRYIARLGKIEKCIQYPNKNMKITGRFVDLSVGERIMLKQN
jgi:hypothetical protein